MISTFYQNLKVFRDKPDVIHKDTLGHVSVNHSQYEEDIFSGDAIWNGRSAFICEIVNTSSILESPLDIKHPPRLLFIGSVLSASSQWTDLIYLLSTLLDGACRVHSQYDEDISSDEAMWNGNSKFLCEIDNTSSGLESPLDITRSPRLDPITSVLSASQQWADPICLLLSSSLIDDACRVHPDEVIYNGSSERALELGEWCLWRNGVFSSLFVLGFS